MQMIENSEEKIIFEAKNYKQCTPNGKRPSRFSGLAFRIGFMFSALMGSFVGIALEKYLAREFNFSLGIENIMILPFWILFFIVLIPIMRPSNLSFEPHRYLVTINLNERKLEWKGRGWYYYRPFHYSEELDFQVIKSSQVQNFWGCYELAVLTNGGLPVSIPMPDEATASAIQQELEIVIQQLPDNPLFDNISYSKS